MYARILIIMALCSAALPRSLQATYPAGEPQIVDVLYISRGLAQGSVTHKTLGADPSIEVLGVPMPGHYSIGDLGLDPVLMNRALRMYMPRNYQQMMSERDMVVLHEAACGSLAYPQVYFDAKWISWFVKAVQEEGMPLSMWGGDASWGGHGEGSYVSWGETMLDSILPFESLEGYNPSQAAFQLPHFIDEDHPLARLPWKEAGPVELLNKVKVKLGATLVAEAVASGKEYPWISWWTSGKGKVVGETQVFGSMGTTNRMLQEWRWYQDFLIYMVYFGADKPIPQDIYRAHRIREEINTHLDKASMLVSLIEFVEKFGASATRLYADLDAMNQREREAEEFYRLDDYDGAAEVFEEIHLSWNQLNAKAVKMKEKALAWVYIIEWSVVSGVALASGSSLWYLMVKRRMYKEVATTRMQVRGSA